MLADAGASAVIVGHSERRTDHGETDALVNAKARAALRGRPNRHHLHRRDGSSERGDGATLEIVRRQMQGSLPQEARATNTVIAYEPVWAIGSGLTPTPADVAEVHGFIRGELGRSLGQAEAGTCASFMAARSNRPMPASFFSCLTWTGRWSAERA